MKHIRSMSLCLLATLISGGVLLPTSAIAANFIVKKQGNGMVVGRAFSTQEFTIPGDATVACKEASAKGKAEATLSEPFEWQLITVTFSGCEVVGLPFVATVSEAMFDFNANGFVRVVTKEEEGQMAKPIRIASQGCEVTIGEVENQTLRTIEYKNLAKGEVEVISKVKGITAHQGEFPCPKPNTTVHTAEFTGKMTVREEGGEIEVK